MSARKIIGELGSGRALSRFGHGAVGLAAAPPIASRAAHGKAAPQVAPTPIVPVRRRDGRSPELASFRTRVRGGSAFVSISGELDLSNRSALERELASLRPGRITEVVLDLAALRFMDVSAMRTLLGYADTAEARGVRVSMVVPDGGPRRLLEMCGLIEAGTDRPESA